MEKIRRREGPLLRAKKRGEKLKSYNKTNSTSFFYKLNSFESIFLGITSFLWSCDLLPLYLRYSSARSFINKYSNVMHKRCLNHLVKVVLVYSYGFAHNISFNLNKTPSDFVSVVRQITEELLMVITEVIITGVLEHCAIHSTRLKIKLISLTVCSLIKESSSNLRIYCLQLYRHIVPSNRITA